MLDDADAWSPLKYVKHNGSLQGSAGVRGCSVRLGERGVNLNGTAGLCTEVRCGGYTARQDVS